MLTIETWLQTLGRRLPIDECPIWPPDLYAIAATLLKRSGAYLRLFDHRGRRRYLEDIETTGTKWLKNVDALAQPVTVSRLRSARPRELKTAWSTVLRSRKLPISQMRRSRPLAEQLIRMALIADEASAGIGVDWDRCFIENGAERRVPSTFLSLADWMLQTNRRRSFCWEIPADLICVLGKQHTPQRGATLRSLTHHLALHLPSDIEARWIGPLRQPTPSEDRHKRLNLLLLPWPTEVKTEDFSVAPKEPGTVSNRKLATYFRFDPKDSRGPAQFARALRRAISKAKVHADRVDAVVFPELALTFSQYGAAERIALEEHTILISGMRKALPRRRHDLNFCVFQPAGLLRDLGGRGRPKRALIRRLRLTQAKHHRWCLDREQLVNYQLGGVLPVSRNSWENIELRQRLLYFVTLNRMTWSVLLCEDLARQDPAADLIRAVGPNLLIALLMDGPQLSGRWPSRYASVLTEDPGCSVLTLTNLGMAQRCRPILRATGKRAEPSRVVALWRDIQFGEIEITLDAGDDACILSLECATREEYSADGRGDGSETRYPVFAGFKSFSTN